MKIGIVGLKPRQVADLSGRRFNYELSFFDDNRTYTPEALETFARHLDRVIIMHPAVPKKALSKLPASKIHGMSGSVSTIIRYFDTLNIARNLENVPESSSSAKVMAEKEVSVDSATSVVQEPTASESTHEDQTPPPPEVNHVTVEPRTPPAKLTEMIPRGYKSQYCWQPNHTIIQPTKDGSHSYELLDIAVPGDVLRYARPVGTTTAVWKQRMYTLRANRQRIKRQLIEAHFYYGYVDLQVMVDDKTPVSENAPQSLQDVQTNVSELAGALTSLQAIQCTPAERSMWRAAYLACLQHSGDSGKALTAADVALLTYRHRFTV